MVARIFKPAKTAMQSGEGRTKEWQLEFAPASPREIEPLMGWTGTRDMKAEVHLEFDTKEEAIAYCQPDPGAGQGARKDHVHAACLQLPQVGEQAAPHCLQVTYRA